MDDAARQNLKKLDRYHMRKGDYEAWMLSEDRTHFAGNQKVRIVNSTNLHDVCVKAGLDESKVAAAYRESLETGDILFVTYEQDDSQNTRKG